MGRTVGVKSRKMVLGLAVGPLGCREGRVDQHEIGVVWRG